MHRLAGKAALITGGTSGIGHATALLFAQEGASVVVTGRDAARGEQVVTALEEAQPEGRHVAFVRCDVRDASACRAAVEQAVEVMGGLDVLFNNAGVFFGQRPVTATSEEIWDQTLDTNLKSVYLFCRCAIPIMQQRGGGAIVNNASDWGLVGGRDAAAYCASKGGVVLLTRAMALDHAADHIRVNCVCPGDVDTPMFDTAAEALGITPEAYRAEAGAAYPLGRIATAEEVARAVLFLASDESRFITGTALSVDGGATAG